MFYDGILIKWTLKHACDSDFIRWYIQSIIIKWDFVQYIQLFHKIQRMCNSVHAWNHLKFFKCRRNEVCTVWTPQTFNPKKSACKWKL